jgi:predicted acyl esterase
MWGISYPGFYTAMGAIDAHPAQKAASPQAPIADWFIGDDFHHNGTLFLPHAFNFFSSFGDPAQTTPFRKPFITEPPTAISSFSRWDRSPTQIQSICTATSRTGTR